jgi:hypothetical protein
VTKTNSFAVDKVIFDTLQSENAKVEQFKSTATPQTATRLGEIHGAYPGLTLGVKLAMAKSGMSNDIINKIYPHATGVSLVSATEPPKQKTWYQRNVMDKVKTGSRYGFAALNLPLDVIQGTAAQAFDNNSSIDGWFASTDLGSLIKNDTEAGTGYFLGGKARQLQAQRAREYRGTIGGHAWTIGRGLASTVFTPDTLGFNLMSGVFDAATALAVPTIPGAKQVKGAIVAAEEAGKGGRVVAGTARALESVGKGSTVINATKMTAKEIDDARKGILVGSQVDFEKANRWFGTAHAQRVIERTAETNDFSSVWSLFGKKIEPQLALNLAKESDPNKIRLMLLDQLGTHKGLVDTGDIKGGKKVYMSLANRDKYLNQHALGRKVSRAYAYVPNRSFNLFKAESPADQIKHLDTIDRMLKLSLVEPTQARSLLNQAAAVMVEKNPNKIENFTNRFDEAIRKSSSGFKAAEQKTADLSTLKSHQNAFDRNFVVGQRVVTDSGEAAYITKLDRKAKTAEIEIGTESVHREIVDAVFDGVKKLRDSQSRFAGDESSDIQDWGSFNKMNGLPPVAGNDVTWAGPGLTSEFAQHDYYIPDVRQLRRLTASKPINWVIAKQGVVGDPNIKALVEAGQLRVPFSALVNLQEDFWRPIVTLTMGNFVRNTVDSQLMIALSSKPVSSLFRHPFHYLSLTGVPVVGKGPRYKFADLFGRNFDAEVSVNQLSDAQEAKKFVTTQALNSRYQDPVTAWRKATRLGNFTARTKNIDTPADYIRGHADEIGKLNADWLARTLANKSNGDVTPEDILIMIKRKDKDAIKWFDTMKQYYKDGRATFDKTKPSREEAWGTQSIDLTDDQNLLAHIGEIQSRLDYITGKNPELYDIIAQGKVKELNITSALIEQGKVAIGERVIYKQGERRLAQGEITGINQASGEITVRPFAFVDGEATPELTKRLGDASIYDDPNMPPRVVAEIIDPRTPESSTLKDSMSRVTDLFHGKLYNTPIATMERSPVFREIYYTWVNKLADSLDKASINQIINDITKRATSSGKRPELMVGKETWAKLQDLQSGARKSYGTINAAELNAFAAGQAVDDTMKMFYNAVDRRNGVDAMRIISPFAQQWAEFIGRMSNLAFNPINASGPSIIPDVNVLRKGQLIVHGATTGDPDQNGRGFVYKDPQSGQWSFTFPLSGHLTRALFGVESPINASVKGIGQGLDWKPGLGPVATWSVSKLLPDSPSTDTIRSILLPFGERGSLNQALIPTWITKVLDGLTGNEGSTIFMNTLVETMQALSATGKYNTSDSNDRERLMNDAKTQARYLSILRGLTQFTGPASGSYDPKIHAKGGDVYTSVLAQAFREMQTKDYDTAVINFIDVFGEDAFTYMGNKTKSLYGGLDASKQFGDFQRTNKGLFNQFRDVAGFFGPVGTDFDQTVYQRQLAAGERKKLSPEEMLASAEQTVGMAYYRTLRAQFPDSMDDEQQQYMSQYRDMLNAKYPGYAQMVYDPNKVPKQIESLIKAAARPDLDNNNVALAVRNYAAVRQEALVEASNRGLSSLKSEKVSDLQNYLASYARALTEKYPEFARVYDRLLSKEVE